jgi:hypothetical protein
MVPPEHRRRHHQEPSQPEQNAGAAQRDVSPQSDFFGDLFGRPVRPLSTCGECTVCESRPPQFARCFPSPRSFRYASTPIGTRGEGTARESLRSVRTIWAPRCLGGAIKTRRKICPSVRLSPYLAGQSIFQRASLATGELSSWTGKQNWRK